MEWNDPVVGQIPHFGPFSLRKPAKGVPKRWKINLHHIYFINPRMIWYHKGSPPVLLKINLHHIYFINPRMIWYHKGSPPVLFWDEKRSCLGPGGLLVETQCQNLNWISVPTTGVVLLAPNFMNHLVISFKHDLHQESHISGHSLRWPPLIFYYCILGMLSLSSNIWMTSCVCNISPADCPACISQRPCIYTYCVTLSCL